MGHIQGSGSGQDSGLAAARSRGLDHVTYRSSHGERIKQIPLKVLLSFKGKAVKVRLSLKGKEVTSTPYFLWIKKGARHVTLNDFAMSAIVLPPSRDAFQ